MTSVVTNCLRLKNSFEGKYISTDILPPLRLVVVLLRFALSYLMLTQTKTLKFLQLDSANYLRISQLYLLLMVCPESRVSPLCQFWSQNYSSWFESMQIKDRKFYALTIPPFPLSPPPELVFPIQRKINW